MGHKVIFDSETFKSYNVYDDGQVEEIIPIVDPPITTPEQEIAKLHVKIDNLTRKLAQKSVITAKEQDDILLPVDDVVKLDVGTEQTPIDSSTLSDLSNLKGKAK